MTPMAAPRILIIEDDPDVARLLAAEFGASGYEAECQYAAVQGLIAARERPPAGIILDLGLPDFDGQLVISRLRATSDVPILVLTARESLAEKVQVLDLGANDYVVKPFHVRELLARLQVQLRRIPAEVVVCGELEVAPAQGRATLRGRDLALTQTELRVLARLAAEPGRVFSREELYALLWESPATPGSNLITVYLRRIRQKLQDAGAPNLIRTVRGQGYALRSDDLS